MNAEQKNRTVYPKDEACFLLGGISERKLEYMVSTKEIRAIRIGKRLMIPKSEIERIARGDQQKKAA